MDNESIMDPDDREQTPDSKEKPGAGKEKNKRGIPVWAAVFSILLAALITFQATYVYLTMKYSSEINGFRSKISSVSSSLGNAYTLIDEITKLYEDNYVYDVDLDSKIEELLYFYIYNTGDRYARYYSPKEWKEEQSMSSGVSVGVGITAYPLRYANSNIIDEGIFVAQVMSEGAAKDAGIKRGDVITALNGTGLNGMSYANAYALLRGEDGAALKMTVVRDGETLDFDLIIGKYSYDTVFYHVFERDGVKIGYIRISEFYEVTVEEFEKAVESLRKEGCGGLIYDIRSNGGGYLDSVAMILDYLLPSGPIVKITFSDGKETVYSSDSRCVSNMPTVVLVDGETASAAELFAAALKDYEYATLVGELTYGKGCGQGIFPLTNGGYLLLTSFFYSPPYSGNYDRIGVTPDIEIELDGRSIRKNALTVKEDEDNQLAVAIETILNKIK